MLAIQMKRPEQNSKEHFMKELKALRQQLALLGQPVEKIIPNRYRDRHVTQRHNYLAEPSIRLMGWNETGSNHAQQRLICALGTHYE
jgi:hypothetical protein